MVIYADVLIILNLYINYFLIRASSLAMRRKTPPLRCLLAAGIGAAASLVILLPALPFFVVAFIKAVLGVIIVFTAFGKLKPVDFLICCLCFLVISFMFAGLMAALWFFFAPFGMFYRNGAAYFNIPAGFMVIFTAVAYGMVRLIRYFSDRLPPENAKVIIVSGEKSVALIGIPDTGNGLCDMFSRKPVVICSENKIMEILPENIKSYLSGNSHNLEGIRLAVCRTISSETLIPLFNADSITINGKNADAVVGVCKNSLGNGADCVFNPKLISL